MSITAFAVGLALYPSGAALAQAVDVGALQRRQDVLDPPAPAPWAADAGAVVLPGVSADDAFCGCEGR